MSEQRPIFVFGAGRSGTTLVANLLGLHQAIEPVYETWYLVPVLRLLRVVGSLSPDVRRAALDRITAGVRLLPERNYETTEMPPLPFGKSHITLTAAELDNATRDFVERLVEAPDAASAFSATRAYMTGLFELQARRAGKAGWINKTPAYVEVLPELFALFPEAVFVHVMRDGRDVALSLLKQRWGISSLHDAGARWLRQVHWGLLSAPKAPGRRLLAPRFEDLLLDPGRLLVEIAREAGVGCESEQILERIVERAQIDLGAPSRWREELSAAEVLELEVELLPTLELLGYEPATKAELDAAAERPRRFPLNGADKPFQPEILVSD